jgi:hypothetical protein
LAAKPYVTGKPNPESFTLTAADRDGRIQVRWNAKSGPVNAAQAAVLDVIDGNDMRRYPVDSKIIRSGALDYIRNSADATVTLTLIRDGQQIAQSTVQSIAPVGTPAEPPRVSTSHRARRR